MIIRKIFVVFILGLLAACDGLQDDFDCLAGACPHTLCGGGTSQCCEAYDGRPIDGGAVLGHFCASSSVACRQRSVELFPNALDLRTEMLTETKRPEDYQDCRPVEKSDLILQSPASPAVRFAFALQTLKNDLDSGQAQIYLADVESPQSDPFQCKQHCDENNAFCNQASIQGEAGTYQKLIEEIQEVGPNGVLPKSTVMELFDQEVDECGRGDIFFSSNGVQNAGATDCQAQLGSADDQISLFFSKNFSASVSREDGLNFTIDPEKSPVFVQHSDETSLLNGNLTYVGMQDDSITVRIGDHCIASNF